jgi:methyl-accepting chemotaxis protein
VTQTVTVSRSIATDVAAISQSTLQVQQSGERVQVSATELARLADQLRDMIGKFRV